MKNKRWCILIIVGFLLIPVNMFFVPDASAETWENEYGKLEIYPDISIGIITQVQYCNLTSYVDDVEIDVTFRFDIEIGNPDIWIWRNISHWVRVPDYGMINANYTLVNISNIIIIPEPEHVDFGDIPSTYYRQGTASFWDGMDWWNGTFDIGFDSMEWQNPEHTEAKFYYEYYDVAGSHLEEQYWFDWDNIKDLFSHIEHGGKHYYYVHSWMIKDRLYQFKWSYDVPLGSDGKWDLMAKLSSDPLGTWRVSIDPWWNSDWDYYKTLVVCNKIDDYQMKINVDYDSDVGGNVSCEGHCQTDFDDIRFVYNNATELPYWIENYTSSSQATFWVNNSGNYSSFEMFYGNAAGGNNSDGDTTFDFFDHFDDETVSPWTTSGSPVETGTDVTISGTAYETIYYSSYINVKVRFRSFFDGDSSHNWGGLELSTSGAGSYGAYFHALTAGDWFRCRSGEGTLEETGINVGYLDAYHVYTIKSHGAGVKFDVDDAEVADHTTNYPTVGRPLTFQIHSTTTPTLKVDWVFIGKYNLVEPSWCGFGSEQSRPPGDPPTVSNEYPINNSIGVCPNSMELGITVSDLDGDLMNITFWSNLSGTWDYFYLGTVNRTLVDVVNGTYFINPVYFVRYNFIYYWNVSVSDGTFTTDSGIFNLTTASSSCGKGGGGISGGAMSVLGLCGIFGLLGGYFAYRKVKKG